MKKAIVVILILIVCLFIFVGCSIEDVSGVVVGKEREYAHVTRGVYIGDVYYLIIRLDNGQQYHKLVDADEYKATKIGDVASVRVIRFNEEGYL